MPSTLQISPADNIIIALEDLPPGAVVNGLPVPTAIPRGHKMAIASIARGQPVLKYGYPIGVASADIAAGEHVHTHNLSSHLDGALSAPSFIPASAGVLPQATHRTFQGYRRAGGQVGIRNEIWIIPTVGCVNRAAEQIARRAGDRLAKAGGPVESVFAFPHPFGCSQLGDDLLNTQKVLAGLIRHPNAAAVLVLGLGCENNQMKLQLDQVGHYDPDRIKFFNAQDVGDELEAGVEAVEQLAAYAARFQREPIDARELILGMKCGGSDGLSGVTANPLVGRVADRLSACGGTSLLSEVPEMFGAESVLLGRASDRAIFDATVDLVNQFRGYFRQHDQRIDENPSPGNKDGGISTLAEKSLGCVQKAGSAPIRQVLAYGQPASAGLGGVALVNAPGNDAVSSTAMTVAGAHLILFTTGRGTPLGVPAPTMKISTNSDLARRKPAWIDFDAGAIAEGSRTLDELADQLFDKVLDIASGTTLTQNEINQNREIAIWKNGVTL